MGIDQNHQDIAQEDKIKANSLKSHLVNTSTKATLKPAKQRKRKKTLKEIQRKPSGRNRYTNLDPMESYTLKYLRAKVLLEEGKSIRETAKFVGLSPVTVCRVNQDYYNLSSGSNKKLITQLKKAKSAKFEVLQHKAMDAISPEKLEKSSALQLGTLTAVMYDKQRLEDGKSTENHALNVVDDAVAFLAKQNERSGKIEGELSKLGIDPGKIDISEDGDEAA